MSASEGRSPDGRLLRQRRGQRVALRLLSLQREPKPERITEEGDSAGVWLLPRRPIFFFFRPLSPLSLVRLCSPPLRKASRAGSSIPSSLSLGVRLHQPGNCTLRSGLLVQITRPRPLVGQVLKATLPSVVQGTRAPASARTWSGQR